MASAHMSDEFYDLASHHLPPLQSVGLFGDRPQVSRFPGEGRPDDGHGRSHHSRLGVERRPSDKCSERHFALPPGETRGDQVAPGQNLTPRLRCLHLPLFFSGVAIFPNRNPDSF